MPIFPTLVKRSRLFLLPQLLLVAFTGVLLLAFDKEQIHLAINRHYNSFWDAVMPWFTWLGDGWTITVMCLLLLAWKRRFGLFTGIACLLASGVTQVLKHTLYYGEPRPAWLFGRDHIQLRFVPGVENFLYDSFPSGHTTVAFAFFFSLSLATKNEGLKLLCFCLAAAIGFSRIYLSQHFLGDVFAGSIIGTGGSLLVFWLALRNNWLKGEILV